MFKHSEEGQFSDADKAEVPLETCKGLPLFHSELSKDMNKIHISNTEEEEDGIDDNDLDDSNSRRPLRHSAALRKGERDNNERSARGTREEPGLNRTRESHRRVEHPSISGENPLT